MTCVFLYLPVGGYDCGIVLLGMFVYRCMEFWWFCLDSARTTVWGSIGVAYYVSGCNVAICPECVGVC